MATLVATPGASNANSYLTLAEATEYYTTRSEVLGWEDADDQSALLMWATRVIDSSLSGYRVFVPSGQGGYYRIGPKWTGAPATSTQALAWPRIGMLDRNGNPIASTVIPIDLKNATAELAGVLGTKDITVDNDIAMQGITSVKAGSVALSFAQGVALAATRILPQGVTALLVPSWMTTETNEGMYGPAEFDVV